MIKSILTIFILVVLSFNNPVFTFYNSLNLIPLKRLASESLKLQGLPFTKNISQIDFDDQYKWGELILDNRTVALMTEIISRELRILRKKKPSQQLDTQLVLPVPRFVHAVAGLSYSTCGINDEKKKKAIRSVIDKMADIVHEKCPNNAYPFFNEIPHPTQANLIFVESKSNSSCGTVPLGLTSNQTSIEISCFDNRTISRLIMSALGLTTPVWRLDRDRYFDINWSTIEDKNKYLLHKWNFDFAHTRIATLEHFNYSSTWHDNRFAVVVKRGPSFQCQELFSKLDQQKLESSICPLGASVPPPPPPPYRECVDRNAECLFYQDQNKCSESDVRDECPVTCMVCVPPIYSNCEDGSPYCSSWKDQCHKTAEHWIYMRKNCKQTCRCPELQDGVQWKTLYRTRDVCVQNKQCTILASQNKCKKFCHSNSLVHCFYSDDDGFCLGATGCNNIKVYKKYMKHFQSY